MLKFPNKDSSSISKHLVKSVNIPMDLYQSMQGKYFIGYADNLDFGKGASAWARLLNPLQSGVNLYVNVWTVSDISGIPIRAQFWFNSTPQGTPAESLLITPANTAIRPLHQPKIKLQYATNVTGDPLGGIKAYARRCASETTIVETEDGKYIFPPGGSFLVTLSAPENPDALAAGRVAFGWWEEKV